MSSDLHDLWGVTCWCGGRQMAGRAGRKGLDASGDAIVICKPSELAAVQEFMTAPIPPMHSTLVSVEVRTAVAHQQAPVTSCLDDAHFTRGDVRGLSRALLEAVACGLIRCASTLATYASSTLLVSLVRSCALPQCRLIARNPSLLQTTASSCAKCFRLRCSIVDQSPQQAVLFQTVVDYLLSREYVQWLPTAGGSPTLKATGLGDAVFRCGMNPEDGGAVYESLKRAAACLITDHPLHLLYLVRLVAAVIFSCFETPTCETQMLFVCRCR
jgi:hypothetical protein